jgi:UDP-N-acetylglucosamine 2-epimerase
MRLYMFQESNQWLTEWSEKRIGDRDFRGTVTYDGISLWWFIDSWLYENHLVSSMKIVSVWELIGYIHKQHRADKEDLREGIDKRFSDRGRKKIKAGILHTLFDLKQLMRSSILKVLPRRAEHPEKKGKGKVVIFSYSTNWRPQRDPLTGEIRKADTYFNRIIEELEKRDFDVVCIDTDPRPMLGLRVLFEKKPPLWRFYEEYETHAIKKIVKNEKKRFAKLWENLQDNEDFIRTFDYNVDSQTEINLFHYLKESFDFVFEKRLPEIVKRIEIIENMIDLEKPDAVIVVAEIEPFGLSCVTAAKLKNVPVMGIQHGIILPMPYNFNHYHGKGYKTDRRGVVGVLTPYCPIPDKTAAYGNYARKALIEEGGYPEDSVTVTGDPRYDILAQADKMFTRDRIFERLGLDKGKKMIVWTTQSWGLSREENEKSFNAVYNTVKDLSGDVQLVIKLHPHEFDTHMHTRIANDVGIDPVIIKDIDLYELLYACDLMLTKHSTTIIDAMVLDKPVVTMNFSEKLAALRCIFESDALVSVQSEEELMSAIKSILYDQKTRERLGDARKKFIYEHAYKQDGKAAERIVDVIEEMIEESKYID